jgi:dTDP-4-dehydrorhamnose 3,5-epimerase
MFTFKSLEIPEVILIEPRSFKDARGTFREIYKASEFSKFGIRASFKQDNLSVSAPGVLRGMHYQKRPFAQAKLAICVEGEVFDVAVDIRKGSPTYGKWVGETLSAENGRMLYIPEGFAHGFCVLGDSPARFIYKCGAEYSPENEKGFVWNDRKVGIKWPVKNPIVSPRDAACPALEDADNDFTFEGEER